MLQLVSVIRGSRPIITIICATCDSWFAHNQCKGATTARPNFVLSQNDEVWGWRWIFEALLGKQLSMTTSFSSFSVFQRLRFIFLLSIYRCKFSKQKLNDLVPNAKEFIIVYYSSSAYDFHDTSTYAVS